jgi:hypothetical protein
MSLAFGAQIASGVLEGTGLTMAVAEEDFPSHYQHLGKTHH